MSCPFILERVAQPEIEPVTLAEAKRQVREYDDITTYDDDITALITGAREWVEKYTGRALIDQTWRLTLNPAGVVLGDAVTGYQAYPNGTNSAVLLGRDEVLLRRSPIIAIASFVSVDSAGVETDVDATTYELREVNSKWPRVAPLNGATFGSGTFRITFRAGYANRDISPAEGAEKVPTRFKQAIKLWVEAHYDRDEKMMPLLLQAAENMVKDECLDVGFA